MFEEDFEGQKRKLDLGDQEGEENWILLVNSP